MTGKERISVPLHAAPMVVKEGKKRPAPVFIPHAVKKRKVAVQRTHSPKPLPSPVSTPVIAKRVQKQKVTCQGYRLEVKRVAPTVNGVIESARLMSNGKVLVMPTETVYMACTSVDLSDSEHPSKVCREMTSLCKTAAEPEPFTAMVQRSADIGRLLALKSKPYAVREADGSASKPACFHEGEEVLRRLVGKFWPGPVCAYIRVDVDNNSLPKQLVWTEGKNSFVRLSNPSHPLAIRLLKEVKTNRLMVATPVRLRQKSFVTKASDAWTHFFSQVHRTKQSIHILNGEDKRELFVVPTCQYEMPCPFSLWIDDSTRTVYVRGRQDLRISCFTANDLLRLIFAAPKEAKIGSPMNQAFRDRRRVITAVLRRWKVVDQRSNTE